MREILEQGLAELGVDAACVPGLTAFSQLLLEKNKVMNLTAITEPEDVARLHLLDSLYLLKSGGRFALVHRPERLCALLADLTGCGLEPKRMQMLQHSPAKPPSAVLLEAVRQGRAGLEVLPVQYETR